MPAGDEVTRPGPLTVTETVAVVGGQLGAAVTRNSVTGRTGAIGRSIFMEPPPPLANAGAMMRGRATAAAIARRARLPLPAFRQSIAGAPRVLGDPAASIGR
jgi:hypothetical protein